MAVPCSEAGVANLAGAHLMAVLPEAELGCEYYTATYYLTADILAEQVPIEAGAIHLPDGPGLGVEVDPERLAQHSLESRG